MNFNTNALFDACEIIFFFVIAIGGLFECEDFLRFWLFVVAAVHEVLIVENIWLSMFDILFPEDHQVLTNFQKV